MKQSLSTRILEIERMKICAEFRCMLLINMIRSMAGQGPGGSKEMSSILANSALVHEPKCEGGGGGRCGVAANEYSCAHGANNLWISNSIFYPCSLA
jgi:hypothetical protein